MTPAFLSSLTAVANYSGTVASGSSIDMKAAVFNAGHALPSVQMASAGAQSAQLDALERNLGAFEATLAAKEQALNDMLSSLNSVERARRNAAERHVSAEEVASQAAARYADTSVEAYTARAVADAALLAVEHVAVAHGTEQDDESSVTQLRAAIAAERAAAQQAAESAFAAEQAALLASEAAKLADALAAAAEQEEARALWREAAAAAAMQAQEDERPLVSDAAVYWVGEMGTSSDDVTDSESEVESGDAHAAARWLSRVDGDNEPIEEEHVGFEEDNHGAVAEERFDDAGVVAAVSSPGGGDDALDAALLGLGDPDVASSGDMTDPSMVASEDTGLYSVDAVLESADEDIIAEGPEFTLSYELDFPQQDAPSPGPLLRHAGPASHQAAAFGSPIAAGTHLSAEEEDKVESPPTSPTTASSAVAVAATVAALSAALVVVSTTGGSGDVGRVLGGEGFPMPVTPEVVVAIASEEARSAADSLAAMFASARAAGDDAYMQARQRLGLTKTTPASETPAVPLQPPVVPASAPVATFVDVITPAPALPPPSSLDANDGGNGFIGPPPAPAASLPPPSQPGASASLLTSLVTQPTALGSSVLLLGLGVTLWRTVYARNQEQRAAEAAAAAAARAASDARTARSRSAILALATGLVSAAAALWVQFPSATPDADMLASWTHGGGGFDGGSGAVIQLQLPFRGGDDEGVIDVEALNIQDGDDMAAALVTMGSLQAPPVEAETSSTRQLALPAPGDVFGPELESRTVATAALSAGAITLASLAANGLLRKMSTEASAMELLSEQELLTLTETEFKRRFAADRAGAAASVVIVQPAEMPVVEPQRTPEEHASDAVAAVVAQQAEQEAAVVLTQQHMLHRSSASGSASRAMRPPKSPLEWTRQEADEAIIDALRTGWMFLQRVAADARAKADKRDEVEQQPQQRAEAVVATEWTRQDADEAIVGALRTGWAFIKRVTADARVTAEEVHVKSTAVVVEEPVESDVDGEAVNGEQVHQPLSAMELVACDVEGVVVTQHHQEEGEDEVTAVMQEAPLPVEPQDDALTSAAAAAAAVLADEPAQQDAVAAAAAELAELAPALVPIAVATPVSISMSAVRRAAREAVSARERLLMSSSSSSSAVYEGTTAAAASEKLGVHASMHEPLALLRAAEEAAAAATVVYMAALADAPMELLPPVSSASETLSAATPQLEEGPQEVEVVAESFIEEPVVADASTVTQPSVEEPVVEAPQPQPVALPPMPFRETPQPSARGLSRHAAAAAARAQHKAKRRAASAQAGRPVMWRKEGGGGHDGDASRALRWLAKLDGGDVSSPGAAVLSDGYDGAVSEYSSGTEGGIALRTLAPEYDGAYAELHVGDAPHSAR